MKVAYPCGSVAGWSQDAGVEPLSSILYFRFIYGTSREDNRVIINRIDEAPEPVRFFVSQLLKKQYVPVAAVLYQDVEPYKIDEWDDWWFGGEYEVLIVLDGEWDSDEFIKQQLYIIDVAKETDRRFGDIFSDTFIVGFWVNPVDIFWGSVRHPDTYQYFMFNKGKIIYATERFFKIKSPAEQGEGIYGTVESSPQEWFEYAKMWFQIAEYSFKSGFIGPCAYSYRMTIELSFKSLLVRANASFKKGHNLLYYLKEVNKYYIDVPVSSKELNEMYPIEKNKSKEEKIDFRYPDSSWIPTKEDIEKFFRPTAKQILDHVSSKINQ